MRSLRTLLVLIMLALLVNASAFTHAQEPDADGDGIPDSADFCWLEPGTAEFSGCTAETFPDFDADGIGDPVDTCVDQPGPAENSGCPIGVTPDLDLDGIPDSEDACPREPGLPEHNGCPPDADGDGIPDDADACADLAGEGFNLGCPDGVRPLDSDGDSVPDLLDACPQQSGSVDLGGCPDADGDGVPDSFDACPDQPGQSDLFGCSPITSAPLPASQPITAVNVASVAEVARLVVGAPRFSLAGDRLALRASDALLTYDLTASTLEPLIEVSTGWSGYPVAISGDGLYIATLEFPADFSTPPYVQVRDGATGAPLYQVAAQTSGSGFGIAEFAFNPVLPLLAAAETPPGGISADQSAPVLLWDAANNRSAGQLAHPITVINLAFSGDGSKLATDSYENGSMNVSLWDVGTQTRLSLVNTTPIRHFMGTPLDLSTDGMRAAVGYPDGSFSLWLFLRESGGPAYNVPLFEGEGEVVSAVAFSPDDSIIAVAGGVPFSGGLSGEEQFPIFLLDATTGATFARLDGHDSLIHDLAFTADGRFLISGGDSTVKFWGIPG